MGADSSFCRAKPRWGHRAWARQGLCSVPAPQLGWFSVLWDHPEGLVLMDSRFEALGWEVRARLGCTNAG